MNRKFLLLVIGCMLGFLRPAWGDGFIVITEPTIVPPGHFPFAPLEVTEHHVEVKIKGQVASTSVDQEFFNPNDQRLEGTYLFPVPKGAHIDKFSMDIGGKQVEAELLDASKARAMYEEIVRKMRDPALLEYAGRDVFKVRIFPIEPHSRKRVKLTYTALVKQELGALSYIYPLGTEKFSAKPIKSLSIKVELDAEQPLASIYSPSHKVEIKREKENRAVIGYEGQNEKPEGDFELVFTQASHDLGANLLSYRSGSEDGYFVLLAAPTMKPKDPVSKDVVFVLDSSGSMAGAKIDQAKRALEFCVSNLNAGDRFEIIGFSTDTEPLFDKLVPASTENRKKASEFITRIRAMGGTDISGALQAALKRKDALASSAGTPFVVIFLTDGLPTVGETSEDAILSSVSKGGNSVRVFPFGIGSDVNTHLLDRLAESTRAFSQYVLATEDIEVKVSNFFSRIKEPVMTNLHLEFSGGVKASKLYPAELPDLFQGDQLVIAGRYSGSGNAEAHLTGMVAGKEVKFDYPVTFLENATDREFIPRLWATRRVGFLLDEIRLHGENAELREEVTALARQYGIVTPYTAYLILEDETRRNVPAEHQSLNQMRLDTGVVQRAKDAWGGFKDNKSGASAVADARSQNAFKYAEQPGTAITAGNTEVFGGAMAASPATKPETDRLAQYTQQAKYVNGRAFFQNGNQWIDGKVQTLNNHQQIKFNSPGYFEFLSKHPESAPWLALGPNVQIALGDTVYEISE